MRRADRLFQILQVLRRSSRPVTAAQLAAELEVSPRSIYRDMADLLANRTPIRGEAGVGYVLSPDFDMPPLMLTVDEAEAAVLGAQWVAEHAEPALALAARDLLAKIAAAIPEHLQTVVIEPAVGVPPMIDAEPDRLGLAQVRASIRRGGKIRIRYCDEAGQESERTIWPVVLGYADRKRFLPAWCEARQAFRHFRVDRIFSAEFLDERHGVRPAVLRARWRQDRAAQQQGDGGAKAAAGAAETG